VTVGGNAAANDEYTPAVIAPRGDGSAWLAWTDKAAASIRMASLTAADALDRALPGVPGLEVHAMLATPGGAALAVVADDPDIYSPKYCRGSSTPDKNVCGKMELVRLGTDGAALSRTTLTKKGNVDSIGAQFIWWYGHTARLATDGATIGVYYRSAMSTARPGVAGEVDIHAGDTLKFVDASGKAVAGGWDWGCSHSWSVRTAWNGTQWGATCHGDAYPNAMQHARLSTPAAAPDTLQWLADTDPTQRALGGLVGASDGFWMNFIQPAANGGLSLQLAKLPNRGTAPVRQVGIGAATGLDAGYPFRPYMAALGNDRLLLGWKSGGALMLAVAQATDGTIVEGPVASGLSIDSFQDMVTAPNGDVVWAHGRGGSQITVNRVAACRLPAR